MLERVADVLRLSGQRENIEHLAIMKSGDIFKSIFGLAVRILGLVFLYLGLSAVPPLLDLGAIETAARGDIIAAILPIVFNLLVGWWLIGGGLLIRRAYPEAPGFSHHSRAQGESTPSPAKSDSPRETANMDAANKKLESLVEKQIRD